MTDNTQQPEHHSSRRFIKGVHRAFFSPVEPEDIVVTPTPKPQGAPQPQVVPQPVPVAAPVQSPIVQPVVPPPAKQDLASSEVTRPSPVHAPVAQPKRKGSVGRFIFFLLLGLVVAGAGGYSFYMYRDSQLRLAQLQKVSPSEYIALEDEALVKRVARHIMLPNETPFIRTLEGVDAAMRSDPFFVNAKDGDKVLVFSKRAILYDPDQDKVIEVGAIRQVTPATETVQNSSSSASPSVAGAATSSGKFLIKNDKK